MITRRLFLWAAAALSATPGRLAALSRKTGSSPRRPGPGGSSDAGRGVPPARSVTVLRARDAAFDPWIEVDSDAIAGNAREASRLAGGRPLLAVVKNNGYGLGVSLVAAALEPVEAVAGCAVVTAQAATELADSGFSKPIVLMGRVDDEEAVDLASRGVRLTTIDESSLDQLSRVARRLGRPVPVQVYLDTGMNRVGLSFRRAPELLERLAAARAVQVEGTFMGFAEDDFDATQLVRFTEITQAAQAAGIDLGRLHAASSHGLFFRPEAHLDQVRPGLALYGAYPDGARALEAARLTPAFRLRARVARVERLETGDSVSYGRNYVAQRPTWIATLPVGHADGYPRAAVDGCEVLVGDDVYAVVGAVSASHTILEIGSERTVEPGDEAILVGPDHAAIHPNAVAERAGISVYDVLMHLSSRLPRVAS